ncbi:cytochrome c peroxidase [Methylobacter sp. sgz302048]|uniref:cytochrome c peroxidase n=1 Tax=Methylobacter sp. sgz302048 TaxID=3455945 RepID=UPI003FA00096
MNSVLLTTALLAISLITANGYADPSPAASLSSERLEFIAPEPGTYHLPALGTAADGAVLNTEGKEATLHDLMGDKVVLLSFIYATCSDANGCPLATSVLHKIKNRLKKEPELAKQLRLLTLSFNPEHDTPAMMKQYGQAFQEPGVEWRFLTTRSERQLLPILDSYKQTLEKVYDDQGRFTGTFSHILRVYLIDKDKQLRNIYSVSFLQPEALINDIKTVLLAGKKSETQEAKTDTAALYAAGDNKSHYERSDYETHSMALADRTGQSADLLKTIRQPPLGLPAVSVPDSNPLTADKVNLGRKLFYDRRLSLNNTFSCAMCHIPEQGFTSNEMATAVGIEGRTVRRNTPTIYNAAYAQRLFHDGRENALEQQVWLPLLAHNEMGNPSIGYVLDKVKSSAGYNELFKKIFGKGPDMESLGMAIASYERTLNSANSAFDRWYYAKDPQALDAKAQRGFKLFTGKANCSSCHVVTAEYALFTDNSLHNTGIGYAAAMGKTEDAQRVQVAPGLYVDVAAQLIDSVSGIKPNDLGRYEITQNPDDRWKYKTPSLRNISLTAPYMHNGSLGTLRQVIEFYNKGGIVNENLDPLIKPLNLTSQDMDDLEAFLNTLTGDNVRELVSDAFAAPVGDAE